jgi:DNA-binding transcriptional LysR family regulator
MKPSKPLTPHEPADSDWNDLKVLLALSRGGSVAAAARAMGVDQSTVSRRLAALEEAVGCPLLLRGGREFTWTAEGRTMIAAAEAAESAVQTATRQLRTARLDATGLVRVTTTPGVAAMLLRYIQPYLQKHPGLEIDLTGSMEHVDLAKGGADIGVRGGTPTEPDLIARHVMRIGWCVYASEGYLHAAGRPQSKDDLPRHRLVLMTPALQAIATGLRWLEDHRSESTAITRVDNLQAAEQMARLGRGLVVLPAMQAEAEPGLVRVFAEPVTFSDGYIVYHESLRGVPRIQAAVEVLAETIAGHGHVWSGVPAKV